MDTYCKLLVGFAPQTDCDDKNHLHQRVGARFLEAFDEIDVDVVEVKTKDLSWALDEYRASCHVAFVEENTFYYIHYEPNDFFLSNFGMCTKYKHFLDQYE